MTEPETRPQEGRLDERTWITEAVDRIENSLAEDRLVIMDVELRGERRLALAELVPHPARVDIALLGIIIDADLMKQVTYSDNSRLRTRR